MTTQLQAQSRKISKFRNTESIHAKWTDPVDKSDFKVSEIFSTSNPLITRISQGVLENFISPRVEKNVAAGDIYAHDLEREVGSPKITRDFVNYLTSKRKRFTIPMCHIWKVMQEGYHNPSGKFGIRKGGKGIFLTPNRTGVVLPLLITEGECGLFIDTVTADLQTKDQITYREQYLLRDLVSKEDTLFYFVEV